MHAAERHTSVIRVQRGVRVYWQCDPRGATVCHSACKLACSAPLPRSRSLTTVCVCSLLCCQSRFPHLSPFLRPLRRSMSAQLAAASSLERAPSKRKSLGPKPGSRAALGDVTGRSNNNTMEHSRAAAEGKRKQRLTSALLLSLCRVLSRLASQRR